MVNRIKGCRNFTWEEAGDYEGNNIPDDIRVAVELLGELLEQIRAELGFPLKINSWYRSPNHPIERAKDKPGVHTTGLAVDIGIYGDRAYKLLWVAMKYGVERIGIKQTGNLGGRFIHLDIGKEYPRPRIWSY